METETTATTTTATTRKTNDDAYCQFFQTLEAAEEHLSIVARVREMLGHTALRYALNIIDGPEDNFAVVDIATADEILADLAE